MSNRRAKLVHNYCEAVYKIARQRYDRERELQARGSSSPMAMEEAELVLLKAKFDFDVSNLDVTEGDR